MNETVKPPVSHDMMANAIRFLAADAVEKANSGHPGMPMGMADVATVLFTEFLKFDAAHPHWPDRDRFVLSAGHGSMLLYACMYLTGYPDMPIEEIKNFRQLHSKTPGHPEYGHTLGVESTTGPLGQGLATSIGMAIAERDLSSHYGPELVDHHTWVICGDGCLMEGVSHEAIDLAGHLKLKKLTVLWDNNHITIDGATSLATSCDQLARFAAHGWHTIAVDGHNPAEIRAAMTEAKAQTVPTFIACHTTIGFGAPTKAGTAGVHGSPLGAAELAGAREKLGWPYPPFEVPAECLAVWRTAGSRGAPEREAWLARYTGSDKRAALEAALDGAIPSGFAEKFKAYKADLVAKAPNVATRKSSEMALEVINAEIPIALGGSADLTHSNLTLTKGIASLTGEDFSGRYIRYGIREFGMSAAMNGIAVHGGYIPFGGTFACFSDYARGAIRLSALMGIRVIYVLTHDSIGLGEDGPTHQPIEHYAMLRATPNLHVFRPGDAVETAECWEIALHSTKMPSVLLLSRQNMPTLRKNADENLCAKGGYVLQEADGKRDVTLIATGSELSLAVEAAKALAAQGKKAAVVSLPCFDLFEKQDAAYRASVLGAAPRIAIEAASSFGWDRYLGETGGFIGMHGFGASAPIADLYKFFGITAEATVAKALELIG